MPSTDTVNKENITIDSTGLLSTTKVQSQKSRSKSIGPGGLDALKEGTGNRREAVTEAVVKSILKPTVSLSPPKAIPPHRNARKEPQSPRKTANQGSPRKQTASAQEGVLIDTSEAPNGVADLAASLPNPFGGASPKKRGSEGANESSQSLVAIRTEEEQQEAVRERERLERKDARRRSLGKSLSQSIPEQCVYDLLP
ncbi:MAG: hypothetical protein Q9174_003364 [Haloplaca sp. 1 TL-2023]